MVWTYKLFKIIIFSAWASVGTVSTLDDITGFPMVNVMAVADSPLNAKSSGDVFFYLSSIDYTSEDLTVQNKITMLFSSDNDLSCSSQGIDAMEPTCPRAILSGRVIEV